MITGVKKLKGLIAALSMGAVLFTAAPCVLALPVQQGNMTAGVSLDHSVSGKLSIAGKASNNVISWQSFDIAKDENVSFDSRNYLNLVHDAGFSTIYGTLTGGGNIYLINPNGVLFGEGSCVNVGNLYVSTKPLDCIDVANFSTGGTPFTDMSAAARGDIANLGTIRAEKVVLDGNKVFLCNDSEQHIGELKVNASDIAIDGSRKKWQDEYCQTLRDPAEEAASDRQYPTAKQIGLGTLPAATQRIFTQGPLQTTENPTDVAIQGEGFFRITMPDGSTAYTRNGNFKLDASRRLVTAEGYPLADNITFDNAESVTIAADGTVSCLLSGGRTETIGNITLARFTNPGGLTAIGKNLFVVSAASGAPIESTPGLNGAGVLTQRALEMSTAPIVEEMVNMIVSQRAYEVNSKAVTTSDSMLEIANSLKR